MDTPAALNKPPSIIEWTLTHELDYTQTRPDHCICFNCGSTRDKLLKCGRCQTASYCQKECQVHDWKSSHKHACDSYKRVGPLMVISDPESKASARQEIFGRIRFYACPYAVHKERELGKGFLFIQSTGTLASMSLAVPKDSYGRVIPNRSLVVHYLTLGEYDSEVCREDFELATVRPKLKEAIDVYDEEKQVVLLMRFQCGHLAVGIAPLVLEYAVCRKLGSDYYASSDAGALQLNIDDL